jgi:hypothetical protein
MIKTAIFSFEADLPTPILMEIGKGFVQIVVEEASKDLRNRRKGSLLPKTPRGRKRFLDSFTYAVRGNRIFVYCSYTNQEGKPLIDYILEGTKPYRMPWLQGLRIPIEKGGSIKWVTPPKNKAWIHPAIKKSLFLERAIKRFPKYIEQNLSEMIVAHVARRLGEKTWKSGS